MLTEWSVDEDRVNKGTTMSGSTEGAQRALLVLCVAALGACAHAASRVDRDPVDETMRRITALTDAQGGVVCAAERLESDRALRALLDSRSERDAGVAQPSGAWRLIRNQSMNLSQASEMMSQSFETAKSEARSTEPGAGVRSARAFAYFDAYSEIAANQGVRVLRRGQMSPAQASWAAAQYAAVWSEYYASPEGSEARGVALDWLTARSMAHPAVLVEYQEDFDHALRKLCMQAS